MISFYARAKYLNWLNVRDGGDLLLQEALDDAKSYAWTISRTVKDSASIKPVKNVGITYIRENDNRFQWTREQVRQQQHAHGLEVIAVVSFLAQEQCANYWLAD